MITAFNGQEINYKVQRLYELTHISELRILELIHKVRVPFNIFVIWNVGIDKIYIFFFSFLITVN